MLLVITCLLAHDKRQEELEQARQIEEIYKATVLEEIQEQEHQVQTEWIEIKTPEMLERILPREEQYYEDLDLLAHTIHAENSNEVDGEEACWNTVGVIINRVYDSEYPNNLYDVLYQQGQYECTWNGTLWKEEPTDIEYEIAADALEKLGRGEIIIPREVLFGAEFRQGSGVYEKIGNTYYCYK